MQMVATLVCGYVMMYSEGKEVHTVKPAGFVRHMAIVGGLRFCTVLAGLLALNYVAVSFTETVKSSAPAFTVVISRLILGQTTPSESYSGDGVVLQVSSLGYTSSSASYPSWEAWRSARPTSSASTSSASCSP